MKQYHQHGCKNKQHSWYKGCRMGRVIVSITTTDKFNGASMSFTEVADGTAVQSR
jgi:hypothetical protein